MTDWQDSKLPGTQLYAWHLDRSKDIHSNHPFLFLVGEDLMSYARRVLGADKRVIGIRCRALWYKSGTFSPGAVSSVEPDAKDFVQRDDFEALIVENSGVHESSETRQAVELP